ncbi:DUF5642 family protein [Mycobacteroides abscessus]|uniref:DUF5642 family protein n=1 Tax=Mycobacteroides abscessus TaxID=36809 RepID=UPI0011C47535|nr:DUF5642 family protein [Mycobacteroides abscessus]
MNVKNLRLQKLMGVVVLGALLSVACGPQQTSDNRKSVLSTVHAESDDYSRILKVGEVFPASYNASKPTTSVVSQSDRDKDTAATAHTAYTPVACKDVDNLMAQLQVGERTTALNVQGDGQVFIITAQSAVPDRHPVPGESSECTEFQIDSPGRYRGTVSRPKDTPDISGIQIRGYHTVAVTYNSGRTFEEYRYYAWLPNNRIVSVILVEDSKNRAPGIALDNSLAINALRKAVTEFGG